MLNRIIPDDIQCHTTEEFKKVWELISCNVAEILNPTEARIQLQQIASTRRIRIFWGTAPTGLPHIAYFIPMLKICDYLKAGCEVTILLADLHAQLDNQINDKAIQEARCTVYLNVIQAMLHTLNAPNLHRLKFIRGSTFQLSPEYTLDMYRLTTLTTERNALKAGAEVVHSSDNNPLLCSMLYPLLQALDEQYLNADIQHGGQDQRRIFTFAESALPRLNYNKRIHTMNAMLPSLLGNTGKMSASSTGKNAPITFVDTAQQVQKKIAGAFCEPGIVDTCSLFAYLQNLIFHRGLQIEISREDNVQTRYINIEQVQEDFRTLQIHPRSLKASVVEQFNLLLQPMRNQLYNDNETSTALQIAYQMNLPVVNNNTSVASVFK
jgi:tyrosyl-tRNA synthetase